MSGFLSNIISRHENSENTVGPRLKGIFEQNPSIPPQWIPSPFPDLEDNTPTSGENQSDESERKGPFLKTEKEYNAQLQGKPGFPKNKKNEIPTENPTSEKKVISFLRKPNPTKQPIIDSSPKEDASIPEPQKMMERQIKPDQKENSKDKVDSEVPGKNYFSNPFQISKEGNPRAKPSIEKGLPLKPHLFSPINPEKVPANFKTKKPTSKKVFEPIRRPHSSPSTQQDIFGNRNHQINVPAQQSLPSIRIHIGRIDIKAVNQQPNSKRKSPDPIQPRISLNQFLEKKDNR